MHTFQRLSGSLFHIMSKDLMQVWYFNFWCIQDLQAFLSAASHSFDLERFIINSIAVTKTISTSIDEVRKIFSILDRLRLVLSILITPGLSADVDSICYGKLGAFPSSAVAGLSRYVFPPCLRFSYDWQSRLQHWSDYFVPDQPFARYLVYIFQCVCCSCIGDHCRTQGYESFWRYVWSSWGLSSSSN